MIKSLHAMDDHEVYLNVKNGHPPMTAEQKAAKKEWEEAHPGEKYTMNWNLSLDYIVGEDDEEVDKSHVLAGAFGRAWIYRGCQASGLFPCQCKTDL